jgi:two-component SAPR family response regulator
LFFFKIYICKQINLKINPNIEIIFVSADYILRDKAFEVGVIEFVEKPIDLNTLITTVKRY